MYFLESPTVRSWLSTVASQITPLVWGAFTFFAGVATKGVVDSFLRRRDETHKFLLDRRVKLLEEQLSKFYWPIYLFLQKDNLIWERLKERDQDPNSEASRLSMQIESGVILPNHQSALSVIEEYLHLAGDQKVLEVSLRYVRHVKIYEMLRAAGIKSDPVNHGEAFPADYFPLIRDKVSALQAEYDQLILKFRPTPRKLRGT